MKNYQIVQLLVLVFLVSVIVQNSFFILKANNIDDYVIAGKVTNMGQATICINNPPVIQGFDCREGYNESLNYTCKVNITDADGHSINLTIEAPDENYTFFSTTPDGNVTIQTYLNNTPSNYSDLIGFHTIWFIPYDNAGCSNSMGNPMSYQFFINDKNDPPVFYQTIPDKIIDVNTYTVILNLDDHFMDPDPDDFLQYYKTDTTSIILSFNGNDVIAYGTTCNVNTNVVFTAVDTMNQSAQSNNVNITIGCSTGDEGSGDTTQPGGSGGSGGFTPSCISDWICDDEWSECPPEGIQSKKCIDFMGCDPDNTIFWLYKNCTYHSECEENWICEDWGPCEPDNFQRRECEELSNCESEELKPDIIIPCEYIPTCNDGIKNQDETGIDCGGQCLPCQDIEIPGLLQDQKKLISSIMVLLAFLGLSLLLIYKYFHKEINLFIAKTLLSLISKTKKLILLNDKEAENLITKIIHIENNLTSKNIHKSMVKTAFIARKYVGIILKLSPTFDKEQMTVALKETKLSNDLEKVFISLFNRIITLESKKIKMYKSDVTTKTTELKNLIVMTSNYQLNKSQTEIKEIAIEDKDSQSMKIKKELHNLYIAMIFNEVEISKAKYTDMLRAYEQIPEKDKTIFYEDITRAFNELKYLISIQE